MLGLGLSLTSPTRIGGAITPEEAANLQDLYQVGNPGPSSSDDTPTIVFHSQISANPDVFGGEYLDIYELVLVDNINSSLRTVAEIFEEALELDETVSTPTESELTADPVRPLTGADVDALNNRILTRLLVDGYYSTGALNDALPESYFNIQRRLLTTYQVGPVFNNPYLHGYAILQDILYPDTAQVIIDNEYDLEGGDPYSTVIQYLEDDAYIPTLFDDDSSLFEGLLTQESFIARLFFRKTRAAVDTNTILPPVGIAPLADELAPLQASPDPSTPSTIRLISSNPFIAPGATEKTFNFTLDTIYAESNGVALVGNDFRPLGKNLNGDVAITNFKTTIQITLEGYPPIGYFSFSGEIDFVESGFSFATSISGVDYYAARYNGTLTITQEQFPAIFSQDGPSFVPINVSQLKNKVPGSNQYIDSPPINNLFEGNIYAARAGVNIDDLFEWLSELVP
jgi:hypothetical protein